MTRSNGSRNTDRVQRSSTKFEAERAVWRELLDLLGAAQAGDAKKFAATMRQELDAMFPPERG